jgi:GT2 family glycosyltransferase
MATPEVAILISTRNRYRELCRAVESCLRQKGVDFDILIYDDASTDQTPTIAGIHKRVKYFRSRQRMGHVVHRARAIDSHEYSYFFSLDDDAFFVSEKTLGRLVDTAQKHSDVGALCAPFMESRGIAGYTQRDGLIELRSFTGCATLLHRESVLNAGNFQPWSGVWGGEEREVAYRLWSMGKRIVCDMSVPPLVHIPSPVRNREEMGFYAVRNQIISDWVNVPAVYLGPILLVHSFRLLLYKFSWKRLPKKLAALAAGYTSFLRIRRRPIPLSVYRKILRLPRHGPILLDPQYLREHGVEHWLEITRSSLTGSDVSRSVPE